MSKLEVRTFEEQIRGAGIAGQLERAEENGHSLGLEEGHANGCADTEKKFISKLLKKYSPEEISREYDVPLDRVLEIKNGE